MRAALLTRGRQHFYTFLYCWKPGPGQMGIVGPVSIIFANGSHTLQLSHFERNILELQKRSRLLIGSQDIPFWLLWEHDSKNQQPHGGPCSFASHLAPARAQLQKMYAPISLCGMLESMESPLPLPGGLWVVPVKIVDPSQLANLVSPFCSGLLKANYVVKLFCCCMGMNG